jgi:DNA-binding NarL/FixJ family response regulator
VATGERRGRAVIRVLVVDDHPVVREGMRSYLGLQDDVEVVGEAAGVEEAIALAASERPDVVLLDLQLEDGHGLSVLARVREMAAPPRVLVLTSFVDEDYARQAIRLGAAGYLVKNAGSAAILDGIRSAAQGGTPMDPAIVARLASAGPDPIDELTPREHEVLRLIAQGRSNRAIAAELTITEKTVKTHVSAILRKLDVDDRTQAAVYAKDRGL